MSRSLRAAAPALSLLAAVMLSACAGGTARAAERARSDDEARPDGIRITDRVVGINGAINRAKMKSVQSKLLELDDQSHDPVWVRINSTGGSVEAGLILIDTMRGIQSPTHCVVESKAYSMAGILLTFCDERYVLPHGTVMLHEASYGTAGEDPSNRARIDFLARYLDRLHAEIAERLGLDVETYRSRIRNGWWMLADEAAEAGIVDAVVRNIDYEEVPVRRKKEKTTVTIKRTRHRLPDDEGEDDVPSYPKRRYELEVPDSN